MVCETLSFGPCKENEAPYEILIWLNADDPAFDSFLEEQRAAGHPIRIIGKTPENIGMSALPMLFTEARYEMITQIDDDVICLSPGIAEICTEIFGKYPDVKQLVADVWRDQYTSGARPAAASYQPYDPQYGLYSGPIDGWFSVYHRSILPLLLRLSRPSRSVRVRWNGWLPQVQVKKHDRAAIFHLGGLVQDRLRWEGKLGLLCARCKVFHVVEPNYLSYFNALDFEIDKKCRAVSRPDIAQSYKKWPNVAPPDVLGENVRRIEMALSSAPNGELGA